MENNIKRHSGDNLGGNYSFKFIPVGDVDEIPETFEGAVHHAVELKSNTMWFDGECTEHTMSFKDEQRESDHGSYHEKEFTGIVPKDREEMIDLFNRIKDQKFILDITDNNGTRKLVGTLTEPMYLTAGMDSKADPSGRNEYRISFKGSGIDRSPVYQV